MDITLRQISKMSYFVSTEVSHKGYKSHEVEKMLTENIILG